MLPVDGRIVAPPSVSPESWACALAGEAEPLVLVPGSARGWFGGTAIVAWAPRGTAAGLSVGAAAEELERSFTARAPSLTVACLPYDGPASTARYSGGLLKTAEGWRVWGTLDADHVPVAAECAPLGPKDPLASGVSADMDGDAFRAGVAAVREAIRAGDVYVLNLTRRLTGSPATSPERAFASLVARTRADMAAFWRTPIVTIASASPERFVSIEDGRVTVSPIKGTRPRADGEVDGEMAVELAASEKERAEHVMIVDLERNDIGRVCRSGSVTVDPMFEVIATPYCYQMVSRVSGDLRAGVSLADLLEATFPCGSVTGAPKIAAMRMIAALESSRRGAYTGSLLVSAPGCVDSSVLIRTAEYEGGVVRWGTGGGITIDSDAQEEWFETVLKASPFLRGGSPRGAERPRG